MLALSFSGDLLTSLTHAITNPLADDKTIASLQGVESLYTELEVKPWTRDELEAPTMITLLISEGLLSQVLEKTRLYGQGQGTQFNTNAGALLLTLSLRANTTDARIRMELSRAIHIDFHKMQRGRGGRCLVCKEGSERQNKSRGPSVGQDAQLVAVYTKGLGGAATVDGRNALSGAERGTAMKAAGQRGQIAGGHKRGVQGVGTPEVHR